ncbi:GATA transcription factor 19-like [Salvia miltiorrhiza]|uniref:GATA transcription factor 19-like n=1 Tax=Salvia miltiorrhiza TaxID=226208 RepID=UPI0025AC2C7E|nr:GATA transcription factor 19-like [Salvia miltiorrhiza]
MYHTQSGNSFPMLFSMANGHRGFDEGELYSFASSSPSASVDCTLSLGTPSTRVTNESSHHHHEKKRSSCMSNFGWNILPSKHTPPPSSTKPHRGSTNTNSSSGGDPLLARRCANCDTTSTPLWRNGPRGPKSLCNACGIRYKKEERRATAAAATSNGGGANGAHVEAQYMMNGSWTPSAQKAPCYSSGYGSEYRFMEDDAAVDHRDSEMSGGVPFMSWRFNVTDRPSLVHDFTR